MSLSFDATDASLDILLPETASPRLRALAMAALAGGVIARTRLRRRSAAEMVLKGPRDYQTEVDVAVEAEIAGRLAASFPDHAISGEEQAADRAGVEGRPRILIDPIDGTTNYAWGIPHFGIALAIVEAGEVTCGVVFDCMQGELFAGEAGRGAYLNGERLAVAPAAELENALIGAGLPVPGQVKSVREETYHAALRRAMATTAGVRRLGSASLSVSYVACGRLDGFFEDGLSLHDYGAAALLVREAGGVTGGFAGGPVGPTGDVLVATPWLAGWLREGLAE
jgi:myo-inositol-1(or 4)-monophosphatase